MIQQRIYILNEKPVIWMDAEIKRQMNIDKEICEISKFVQLFPMLGIHFFSDLHERCKNERDENYECKQSSHIISG